MAGIVGAVLLGTFTVLLAFDRIGQVVYGAVVTAMLASIAIAVLPRLQELDLKNVRLVLAEIKQTKAEVEQTKAEILNMYGDLNGIKRQHKPIDFQNLGPRSMTTTGSIRNYISGCITRERERLAKVFIAEKSPEGLARAIVDGTYDVQVFQWAGMGTSIDTPIPPEHLANEPKLEPLQ